MLTKDLLKYRFYKKSIRPQLIDPEDPQLLGAASELIELFEGAVDWSREELQEQTKLILDGHAKQMVIVRGFEKLLMDRTEFNTSTVQELIDWRAELFTQSHQVLLSASFDSLDAYHAKLSELMGQSSSSMAQKLYSDLPPYQQVLHFKKLSASQLLHRYNCAQIQGLLLRCSQMKLKIAHHDVGSLRQLFRYLRFHQLLADIQPVNEKEYQLTIDGPLNLFVQTQKYGINLANFFPAILHQSQWSLEALVQIQKGKLHELALDHSCGIRSHYHQFLNYVPEAFEWFQENFQKKSEHWVLESAATFIPLPGEAYCLPDYVLNHPSRKDKIALELFHPWHSSHLQTRIQQLQQSHSNGQQPLILGVSRKLLKDPLVANELDASEYFKAYGFLFNDMPTADQLMKCLKKVPYET